MSIKKNFTKKFSVKTPAPTASFLTYSDSAFRILEGSLPNKLFDPASSGIITIEMHGGPKIVLDRSRTIWHGEFPGLPVSMNRLWKMGGGRTFKDPAAAEWDKMAMMKPRPLANKNSVLFAFAVFYSWKWADVDKGQILKADCDNRIKALYDSVQKGAGIQDERYFHAFSSKVQAEFEATVIHVIEVEQSQPYLNEVPMWATKIGAPTSEQRDERRKKAARKAAVTRQLKANQKRITEGVNDSERNSGAPGLPCE